MRTNIIVTAVLVVGLIWAIACAINARHRTAEQQALEAAKAQRAAELVRRKQQEPIPSAVEPGTVAASEPAPEPIAEHPKPKPPLQDPDAREALGLVGWDPAAEAYWYSAINDPNLPAEERSDLIEDLNEDGISDPRHPTADDLPVIMRRIGLVEALGPDAMDKINADAFDEAYKDLVNLARLASGQGGEAVK
jgi:hypothetical protein